jgi:tRNA A-37 threonylcarbamoyl transferase component Bud32
MAEERRPARPLGAKELSDEITMATSAVRVGDMIKHRYEVLEHIGSGGMADVYRGWDEQFCRDVAIKVLKLSRINDAMRKRVLREARATCAVDHPNMCRVTDLEVVRDAPVLVMDLLRGVTLAEKLRQAPGGRLDWRYAVSLLLPAMEALHMAHEAGIVHRDIKPENLFLHRRGETEVLMVLDLGIVKFTDTDGAAVARWTLTGQILGTAAYMSPEQANSAAIDRRSDVYSMGVTIYRLLTGQHLFPCATGDGPIMMATRHIFEAPPRLTDPSLPPALVEAVFTALAKDPGQRHASMAVFAEALHHCLEGAPRSSRARRVWSLVRSAGQIGFGATLALAVEHAVLPDAAVADPAAQSEEPVTVPLPPPACDDAPAWCVAPEAPEIAVREEAAVVEPVRVEAPPHPVAPRSPGRRRSPVTVPETPTAPIVTTVDPFTTVSETMRQCVIDHGDPDARSLPVHVSLRANGSVAFAGIDDERVAPYLASCVRKTLMQLRFDPGPARMLEYTYRFTPKGAT